MSRIMYIWAVVTVWIIAIAASIGIILFYNYKEDKNSPTFHMESRGAFECLIVNRAEAKEVYCWTLDRTCI